MSGLLLRLSLMPVALLLASCHSAPSSPEGNPSLAVAALQRDTIGAAAALASACSGCHGSGTTGGEIVQLEGYTREQIYTRFQLYRQNPDGNTAMHRMARGYSDEQVQLIADYLGQP